MTENEPAANTTGFNDTDDRNDAGSCSIALDLQAKRNAGAAQFFAIPTFND